MSPQISITRVRITLPEYENPRLLAYCGMTLAESFAVHDMKIVEGLDGQPFVAMPSKKRRDRCPECEGHNILDARFCNWCGEKLKEDRVPHGKDGRPQLRQCLFHPINSAARTFIQQFILNKYFRITR